MSSGWSQVDELTRVLTSFQVGNNLCWRKVHTVSVYTIISLYEFLPKEIKNGYVLPFKTIAATVIQ